MQRKRLSKRKAKAEGGREQKSLSDSRSQSLSGSLPARSRLARAMGDAFDALAKKLVAGVRNTAYGVAMLFPARSYRTQRHRAMVFAEKCADLAGGSVPVLLSLIINLIIIGTFATVVLHPPIEPRTDEITAALGKFLEEIPEVEKPAGAPQPFPPGLASAAKTLATAHVSTPAMLVPITTKASSAPNFQMSASATTTEASLVAERAAAAASALAAAQSSSGGGGGGHQIGRMKVKGNRLCVILDTSESMRGVSNQSLKTAREIARSSGGEVHEHKGCAIRKGPVYPSDTTGDSFHDIVLKLIRSRNIDAIYWVCDLEDEQNPEAVAELKKLLLNRRVRFYVSSYNYRPNDLMRDLIDATGGAFELKSPLDTD